MRDTCQKLQFAVCQVSLIFQPVFPNFVDCFQIPKAISTSCSRSYSKRPLKNRPTRILMTNGSLMKVESIWPASSDNWSWKPIFGLFYSGHFRQVLLYMTSLPKYFTVKSAVAATSIKLDPPIRGHFRAPPPRTILNANAPLLSVHLSNAASCKRNSPQNTESVSLNGHLLAASLIKFHPLTFLHRSYAWCNLTPQQWCLPEKNLQGLPPYVKVIGPNYLEVVAQSIHNGAEFN